MRLFYLLIVTLAALRLWGAIDIPGFVILAFYLIASYRNIRKVSTFRNIILALVFFLIVNAFTSHYYRGQDVFSTLRQTSPFMMIIGYFFYLDKRFSVKSMEKLIFILTVMFDIVYLVQYALYPYGIVIFPDAETEYGSDVRLRLYGQNICSLGLMFSFNKYLVSKKSKYMYAAMLSFFVLFLWGFRTIFAASFILPLLMYCKLEGVKSLFAITPICLILLILIFQAPIVQDKVLAMLERQGADQSFGNKDYIRNLCINYYLFEHFSSGWEMFWGSGIPSGDSNYSDLMSHLGQKGYHWNDMGLWGLSWVLGVPATLMMLCYGIKASFMKMSHEYLYLTYWFIFSLMTAFTTAEYIRTGNYVIQSIALALLYKLSSKQPSKS